MKKSLKVSIFVTIAIFAYSGSVQADNNIFKDIGQAFKKAGKDIGKTGKKVGKDIGKTAKKTVRG